MVVFAASTAVAVVQPGDLGDDDVASSGTTTTSQVTTTTTPLETTTSIDSTATSLDTTTTAPAVATTIPGSGSTTTTVEDTTTTTVGSGLGAEGAGDPNPTDEVANTGMESMLPLGLALGAVALAGRRMLRTARP